MFAASCTSGQGRRFGVIVELAGGGLLAGGVGRRRCRRCRQIRRRRLASTDVGRRWRRHSSTQSAVSEMRRSKLSDSREIRAPNLLIWGQMRCRCAMPPVHNGGSKAALVLTAISSTNCREWHRASGGGVRHVAVTSGFAVGQWLLGERARSSPVRREGGITWVASAAGVGHVGWWRWSAGGVLRTCARSPETGSDAHAR